MKAMDEMVVDLAPLTFKAPVAFVYVVVNCVF